MIFIYYTSLAIEVDGPNDALDALDFLDVLDTRVLLVTRIIKTSGIMSNLIKKSSYFKIVRSTSPAIAMMIRRKGISNCPTLPILILIPDCCGWTDNENYDQILSNRFYREKNKMTLH